MKRSTFSILAVLATACGPAPTLEQLNQELSVTSPEKSMANAAYFRPLCDDKGYPLVGNINGKVVTTASEFCTAVRGSEHKR